MRFRWRLTQGPGRRGRQQPRRRRRQATAGSFSATDEKALEAIVGALTAARDGDFSVRLPARRRDVIGDVQARVNELVEHERAHGQGARSALARVVGRDGRMTERASLPGVVRRLGRQRRGGQLAGRRPGPPDHRGRPRHRGRRPGRPQPEDGADDRGPAGQGRVLPHRPDRERDGRPARLVRRRGHARRARGRHGRQARRPGRGQGRLAARGAT